MLRRKLYDELEDWMESPYSEALLVKGARQVGKTYLITHFLSERCDSYLKLDFVKEPELCGLFDKTLDIDSIIRELSLLRPGFRMKPGRTVLFLDEIQNCPKAKSALKYFVEDGRFRIIASGSLLGIQYSGISNPVGFVREIEMRSLDFEEFLWAIGLGQDVTDFIRKSIREGIPFGNLLGSLSEYYKIHLIVGGMPECVCRYLETNDFSKTIAVQKKIIEGYREDVAKYSDMKDKYKIFAVFDSIPSQLSKESKKFSYNLIDLDVNPTLSSYESSLCWMRDASMINVCNNILSPDQPLEGQVIGSQFKVYMHDTGLLVCQLGIDSAKSILSGDTRVNRGAIMENAIAEALVKNGFKLRYFKKDSLEIDFIALLGTAITGIDVKSGNNKQAKSLKSLKDKYGVKRRIKFENTDIYTDDGGIEHYPLFACSFIRELSPEPAIDLSLDTSVFGRRDLSEDH